MLATKKWGPPAAPAGRSALPAALRRCLGSWLLAIVCVAWVGCREAPGRPELLRGVRLLENGEAEQAVQPLVRAAQLFSTNHVAAAFALNYLGLALHQSGRPEQAAEAYAAALNRDLNHFVARYNLGCLHLEQDRTAAALRELTTYNAHQPEVPEGWLWLGIAQWRANQLPEAEASFRKAGQLSSSRTLQARALNGVGLCAVRRQRPDDALRCFAAAAKLDPEFAAPILNQAIVLESLKRDPFRAFEQYQAFLDLAPTNEVQEQVRDHVRSLALALRPALPSEEDLAAQGVASLARITNLFSRVGGLTSSTDVASGPDSPPGTPSTSAVPSLVRTSTVAISTSPTSPPPTTSVTGTLAEAVGAISAPPSVASATEVPPVEVVVTATPPAAVTRTGSVEVASLQPAETSPASSPPPLPEPATQDPALEIVQVDPLPALTPAMPPLGASESVQEATEGAGETVAAETEEAGESEAGTTADERIPAETVGGEEVAESESNKRSFFSRINPLNLFRRKPSEKRVTPLPPKDGPAPSEVRSEPETPPEAVPEDVLAEEEEPTPAVAVPDGPEAPVAGVSDRPSPPPMPVRPEIPRYAYLSPSVPASGDAVVARRHFLEAVEAYGDGRLEEAAVAYAEAIEADPAGFDARYNAAALAFERGQLATALQEYEVALAIDPRHPAARFNFALALQVAGYPRDAANEIERMLLSQPGNAEAHLALGSLYANPLEDRAKARAHYQRALEIQPQHPQANAVRRWLAVNRPETP